MKRKLWRYALFFALAALPFLYLMSESPTAEAAGGCSGFTTECLADFDDCLQDCQGLTGTAYGECRGTCRRELKCCAKLACGAPPHPPCQ